MLHLLDNALVNSLLPHFFEYPFLLLFIGSVEDCEAVFVDFKAQFFEVARVLEQVLHLQLLELLYVDRLVYDLLCQLALQICHCRDMLLEFDFFCDACFP